MDTTTTATHVWLLLWDDGNGNIQVKSIRRRYTCRSGCRSDVIIVIEMHWNFCMFHLNFVILISLHFFVFKVHCSSHVHFRKEAFFLEGKKKEKRKKYKTFFQLTTLLSKKTKDEIVSSFQQSWLCSGWWEMG